MVSSKEIIDLVSSTEYQKTLNEIGSRIPIDVRPDYGEPLPTLMGANLRAAQVEISDLRLLISETNILIAYSARKFIDTDNTEENIGLSGESENPIPCGYAKDYLLNNAIEVLVARRGRKNLETYLKEIHIPGQKKYATQIFDWLLR